MAMLVLNDVFERTWRARLHGDWPRLPDEFWPAATRSTPELTYIAEVYWDLESVLLDQGFTFAYDKRLLDALHASRRGVRVSGSSSSPIIRPAAGLVRFLENHDEARSAVTFAAACPRRLRSPARFPECAFSSTASRTGAGSAAPCSWRAGPTSRSTPASVRCTTRCCALPRSDVLHDGTWGALQHRDRRRRHLRDILAYRWRIRRRPRHRRGQLEPAPAQANIPLAPRSAARGRGLQSSTTRSPVTAIDGPVKHSIGSGSTCAWMPALHICSR